MCVSCGLHREGIGNCQRCGPPGNKKTRKVILRNKYKRRIKNVFQSEGIDGIKRHDGFDPNKGKKPASALFIVKHTKGIYCEEGSLQGKQEARGYGEVGLVGAYHLRRNSSSRPLTPQG